MPALEAAIVELARLEKILKRGRPRLQVTLSDERSLAKATSLAWFSDHKRNLANFVNESDLSSIDEMYQSVLESSDRAATRAKYLSTITALRKALIALRSQCLADPPREMTTTADQPPTFAPLVSDQAMQEILVERWGECTKCLSAGVPLAATVMMGGLLEALLLARINKEIDKASVFTAKAAPRDKTGKTRPLSDWMLKDFIDVVHERKWITQSARDVSAVLRDYRNYIHPQKQLSHNIHLTQADASLLWEVCKNMTLQIIASAS